MALYAYISATGKFTRIDGSNINFTGPWNIVTSYAARDAASDGISENWIALTANSGEPIPLVFDTYSYGTIWSHLVAQTDVPPPVPAPPGGSVNPGDWLSDVWAGTNYSAALFNQAITLAETGTTQAQAAYDLALTTYDLALLATGTTTGTVFVDLTGVTSLAQTALMTAWAGTAAGNQAYTVAVDAYALAVAGTSAANSADMWGRDAFSLAVAGTNAAASANSTAVAAYSLAGAAYTLAVAGTDAANEADSWGRDAFSIAVAGTTAVNAVAVTVGIALNTAWAGTAAANSADLWGRDAFSLAVVGTNAANAANQIAGEAYTLATVGTNAANAVNQIAGEAYTLAVAGTTASASKVSKSGDTMTGNLVTPNVQVSSGTMPSSLAVSGTIFYDFSSTAYQTTTVDKDIRVSGTNMAAAREIAVILKSTGSGTRYLTYDTNFEFFGNTPPSTVTTKDVLLALTSTSTTLSSVIAAATSAL